MTEFLKLLAIYYMCDSTAAVRPLSAEEFMSCQYTYETVKSYFSGLDVGTPTDIAARNRTAYAGFKAWEAENAALVSEMRATAEAQLGG